MNQAMVEAIEPGSVMGIVPARSGSKGIKDKNIRSLHGYPLIAYSIAAGLLSDSIDRVLVSTDSERYAEISRFFGAEAPFLRPPEISGDTATDIGFMMHAITWLYENEGSVPEYLVHLRATCPLRRVSDIDQAVSRFSKSPDADCLRSVHPAKDTPYKWFSVEEGQLHPLFSGMKLDDCNRPRQEFPPVFIPDGYVDVIRVVSVIESDTLHGKKALAFMSPQSIDIDDLHDFDEVESYMVNNDSELLAYLEDNYDSDSMSKLLG